MMQMLWILTITMMLSLIILVGILVIMLNFKAWAKKRDGHYHSKLHELEERISILEHRHGTELAGLLKENKDILEKLKKGMGH